MEAVIRGATMQVLELTLRPGESVVAEAGQLGWFDEGIELETSTALAGADGVWDGAEHPLDGGTLFMARYRSTTRPGTVVFPARLPGTIFQIPLGPDRSYLIQRHGFLAGLEGVELSTALRPGHVGSAVSGELGFVLQKLEGVGHAWIELGGEISEYGLADGERLRVHPAHVGVIERGVAYELTTVPEMENKLFGGDGVFLVQLTGPGKVWLQSLSLPVLAHALQPYLPKPGVGPTPAQGLEATGVTAAVKGTAELL